MTSYVILLVLSVLFNATNLRVLALTAIVSAGIFLPVPAEHFYAWCSLIEICVFACAMLIGGGQAYAIAILSAMLIVIHFIGWSVDGTKSDTYLYFVRLYEHSELIVCLLGSWIIKK